MTDSIPLLSVVIPTKNRYNYLRYILEYYLSIESGLIELVIHDNSDIQDEIFLSHLNTMDLSRIKYFYNSDDLSVIENCDLAVSKASGYFVTMIGDDDIFSKHIILFCEFLYEQNIDAALPNKAFFRWPDVNPRFHKEKLKGLFQFSNFNSNIKYIDSKLELLKVLNLGGTSLENLPRLYHGIVKKEILDKVFLITNSYFPGPSPDMANAVSISSEVNSFIMINIPLLVSGHSAKSTGGQGAEGKHHGEVKDIKHLPKDTVSNWNSYIPFYWSGDTIYAQSVHQALSRINNDKFLNNFNYIYLFSKCLVFDIGYKDRVKESIEKFRRERSDSRIYLSIYFYFFIIWIKRLFFHFSNYYNLYFFGNFLKKNSVYYKNNIREVIDVVDLEISSKSDFWNLLKK